MPGKVYDYRCGHCDHVEKDVFVYGEQAVYCPKCDSVMGRMVSAPGMVKTNFHDKPKVRDRK